MEVNDWVEKECSGNSSHAMITQINGESVYAVDRTTSTRGNNIINASPEAAKLLLKLLT